MKTVFNEKTQSVELKPEESDKLVYYKIKETFETEGWQLICGIHDMAKEEILKAGRRYSRVRAKKDLCSNVWSMLDGFCQWRESLAKFMATVEMDIEKERGGKNEREPEEDE